MFSGIVVRGEKVARDLGYPTANLNIDPKKTKLKNGVYAAYIHLKKNIYKGALLIDDKTDKVEAYVVGYSGKDFYRHKILVDAIQKVSEIEPVSGKEELVKKIKKDIELVKKVFSE